MAIIGIHGKMGSGKDTVGSIIQYLSYKEKILPPTKNSEKEFNEFLKTKSIEKHMASGWEIKKFARALKEIVSIMTGISVDDLDKEEVKSRVLGEEWIRYGYADSFIRDMEGNPIMINKQCSKERYEQELKMNWQTAYKHEYTVRDILQLVGTNAMRNIIHEDVWVNILMKDYTMKYSNNSWYKDKSIYDVTEEDELRNPPMYPNWIITDVRFPNEAEAVKSRGGLLISVKRDHLTTDTVQHLSETALDDYTKFNCIIDNNGTIEDLIRNVESIYHHLKF